MDFLLVVLPPIQISLMMRLERSGMKCQGFGGVRLKDYPGRWWVSRLLMGANLDRYNL